MIYEILKSFDDKIVILASGSPRRRDILGKYLIIKVVDSQYDEKEYPLCDPKKYVEQVALNKARSAKDNIKEPFDFLISADTIVEINGQILGKPGTYENAIIMLKQLSGQMHLVHTAVACIFKNNLGKYQEHYFTETTGVNIAHLDEKDIISYVLTNEPLDKAGGYAIQGIGSLFVKGIDGDYYNVMGFPSQRFVSELCIIYNKFIKKNFISY